MQNSFTKLVRKYLYWKIQDKNAFVSWKKNICFYAHKNVAFLHDKHWQYVLLWNLLQYFYSIINMVSC